MKLGALDLPLATHEVHTRDSAMKNLDFAGVDGGGLLDMGDRIRRVTVTGRLPDAITGATKATDIEDLREDVVATLDPERGDGRSYTGMRVVDAFCTDFTCILVGGVGVMTCLYTVELESNRGN